MQARRHTLTLLEYYLSCRGCKERRSLVTANGAVALACGCARFWLEACAQSGTVGTCVSTARIRGCERRSLARTARDGGGATGTASLGAHSREFSNRRVDRASPPVSCFSTRRGCKRRPPRASAASMEQQTLRKHGTHTGRPSVASLCCQFTPCVPLGLLRRGFAALAYRLPPSSSRSAGCAFRPRGLLLSIYVATVIEVKCRSGAAAGLYARRLLVHALLVIGGHPPRRDWRVYACEARQTQLPSV